MAHFAELDSNNVVLRVVVIGNPDTSDENGVEKEEIGIAFCEKIFNGGIWKQTSYNATFRKNYAGIGWTFDAGRDAFIPPSPYSKWVLNEEKCDWEPPIPYPDDGQLYRWDDVDGVWAIFPPPQEPIKVAKAKTKSNTNVA